MIKQENVTRRYNDLTSDNITWSLSAGDPDKDSGLSRSSSSSFSLQQCYVVEVAAAAAPFRKKLWKKLLLFFYFSLSLDRRHPEIA
jgi:hypothetical protein